MGELGKHWLRGVGGGGHGARDGGWGSYPSWTFVMLPLVSSKIGVGGGEGRRGKKPGKG